MREPSGSGGVRSRRRIARERVTAREEQSREREGGEILRSERLRMRSENREGRREGRPRR